MHASDPYPMFSLAFYTSLVSLFFESIIRREDYAIPHSITSIYLEISYFYLSLLSLTIWFWSFSLLNSRIGYYTIKISQAILAFWVFLRLTRGCEKFLGFFSVRGANQTSFHCLSINTTMHWHRMHPRKGVGS